MVEEKVRRRMGFQAGRWVRMADGQEWMFPDPPVPGIDPDYDDLIRCRLESEDADEDLRIELALAIRLLSRNYNPKPDEYAAIFSFGDDESGRSRAQAAISTLVHHDLESHRANRQPARPSTLPLHAHFRTLRRSVTSWPQPAFDRRYR